MKTARISLLALTVALPAPAEEIGPDDFSPTAMWIDFDDLHGGSHINEGEIITDQYQSEGVVFHNPDFATRANANLDAFFSGNTSPNLAFVRQHDGGGTSGDPQEMHFGVPTDRVGFWFGTSADSTVTLRIFGTSGLLEELTKTGVPTVGPELEGFIGLRADDPIVRAEVSSAGPTGSVFNFSMDDVRYEIPAPATLPLILAVVSRRPRRSDR